MSQLELFYFILMPSPGVPSFKITLILPGCGFCQKTDCLSFYIPDGLQNRKHVLCHLARIVTFSWLGWQNIKRGQFLPFLKTDINQRNPEISCYFIFLFVLKRDSRYNPLDSDAVRIKVKIRNRGKS
eukprot:GFUD01002371.1.p1 GENE.GFUD01002371.1~~GFUD01002371.1.p1  ORF type:complete len:127 (-),score=16.17 GFUD01002371.1:358-738(-)